jgi:AraC family chemosensory pili system transcriptional regulator ChpD
MGTSFSQILLRRPGFEAAIVAATGAGAAFPKHTHDEFVISANVAGAERIWLDGRTLEAAAGDVTAYNPGALQASHGVPGTGSGWRFVSLYAEPDFVAQALGLHAPPSLRVPVLRDPILMRHFADLGRMIAVSDGVDDGMAEETAVAIHAATVGIEETGHPAPRGDAVVRRAAAMLVDRLGDLPSLAEIAAEVGVSREHLIRRFASVHGMPPMAWALQRRVARARTLLRGGMPPADVAAMLGFADQAHLTRAFRNAMGTTPGRYRVRA